MRAVGAQEGGVQLAGQVPVGGVAAVAGNETGVFLAGAALKGRGFESQDSSLKFQDEAILNLL
ncbi:hypothetical protein D3C83_135980 [compost metagenome]